MEKLVSIVSSCFNEADNIEIFYQRLIHVTGSYPNYKFEFIIIDNASTDASRKILLNLARQDKKLKLIFNARNFGHIRSPYHAMMQAKGDAVILLASDLQDPPELIHDFIKAWTQGAKIVVGVKVASEENTYKALLRKSYYSLLNKIAEQPVIKNFTGFGLYDRSVIKELQLREDNYPYFRGLVSELGFSVCEIPFVKPERTLGKSKNNFLSLFDMAMLGVTSQSKIPLRFATFLGMTLSLISLCFLNWPLFLTSLQFIFLGILGEYVLAIHRQVFKRPLVVEQQRVNFEEV